MEEPILITGCARSGTSLVAGMFFMAGAWGGKMYGPTPDNPHGFFENRFIREKLVKEYLRAIGADPKGQKPLPNTRALRMPKRWREMVLSEIKAEGYHGGPWFYKGAKMCLMWPVWHRAFPKAKWIIVRRWKENIIESCLKTSFMSAYKDREGWYRWVMHHEQCFEEMRRAGCAMYQIWPQIMIDGEFEQIERALQLCGLPCDRSLMREFIDPSAWSSRTYPLHGKGTYA